MMGRKLILCMLATTDAIVLSLQPQSDKAHILHAYTRDGGRINYRVYGLGRKNTAGKYSPLSILQLTTDEHSIRTAQLNYVPTTLTTDPYKRTVALFISEVLFHVMKHPMPDESMFDFLAQAVQALDTTAEPQNFHIRFLIDFAARLGFAIPQDNQSPITNYQSPITFTRKDRQDALRQLCAYFAEHVDTWQEPKSLDVLIAVFD
jgi:DNA repair protein RecO (recombination protein O)